MLLQSITPQKSLNQAYRKVKPFRKESYKPHTVSIKIGSNDSFLTNSYQQVCSNLKPYNIGRDIQNYAFLLNRQYIVFHSIRIFELQRQVPNGEPFNILRSSHNGLSKRATTKDSILSRAKRRYEHQQIVFQ